MTMKMTTTKSKTKMKPSADEAAGYLVKAQTIKNEERPMKSLKDHGHSEESTAKEGS
jgi:hypothetical protein